MRLDLVLLISITRRGRALPCHELGAGVIFRSGLRVPHTGLDGSFSKATRIRSNVDRIVIHKDTEYSFADGLSPQMGKFKISYTSSFDLAKV